MNDVCARTVRGVGRRARVETLHSVLMDGVVRARATASRSMVADGSVIGRRARIGAPNSVDPVLVGSHRRIAAGAVLRAGGAVQAHRPASWSAAPAQPSRADQ